MAKIQDIDIPYLEFAEAAAPGTPAAGISRVYVKADGLMYSKDDAGVETLMSGGAGGAPADADYLVGTANGSLSAEIVVGASPGGELGGTWAAPTVDLVHAGATAWATYTPTIGASTTPPTIGDGILTGRWKMIDSKTLVVNIFWQFGSTSNQGSGSYDFLLPNSLTSGAVDQTITGHFLDVSVSANFLLVGLVTASQTKVLRTYVEAADAVGSGVPATWAVGDKLHLTGIIEVA